MTNQQQSDNAILQQQSANIKKVILAVACLFAVILLAIVASFVADSVSQQAELEPQNQPTSTVTKQDVEKSREAFKQALAKFEADIQPLLDNQELTAWKSELTATAADKKQTAIAEFAAGNYQTALALLSGSKQLALQAETEWHSDFDLEINKAIAEFNNGKPNQSQLALNNAADVKPSNPKIAELQAKLDVYPEVAKLYRDYDVAVTENNLDKQISLLQQILALDSSRTEIKPKLNDAIYRKKDNQFQQAIEKGLQQIEQGELQQASQSLQQAKALFANRLEVELLANKLNEQNHEMTLSALHEQLRAMMNTDQWQGVLQLATKAEANFPADEMIASSKQEAEAIISLRKTAAIYLAKPERLTDENIQANAKNLIRESIPYLSKSNGLANDIKSVSARIDKYMISYPVTVSSDGKTQIEVLGVGTVGKTENKVIQLTAGTYTFEGRRDGYRNKQVMVTIKPDDENSVKVVCDEQI